MSGLTHAQAACLAAIRRLTLEGVSPSLEELRQALRFSSKGQVHRVLTELLERGRVTWIQGRARSIVIIEEEFDAERIARMSVAELQRGQALIKRTLEMRAGRAA